MRTDPREASTPEQIVPPEARPHDSMKPRARSVPVAQPADMPADVPESPSPTEPISLLPQEAASQLRSRWEVIQSGFVDDPRDAVEQAGALVEEALGQLTKVFGEKREHLQRSGDIPTEDLRQTLRHYRLLLNRLLSETG
jgi:hypothetical protein